MLDKSYTIRTLFKSPSYSEMNIYVLCIKVVEYTHIVSNNHLHMYAYQVYILVQSITFKKIFTIHKLTSLMQARHKTLSPSLLTRMSQLRYCLKLCSLKLFVYLIVFHSFRNDSQLENIIMPICYVITFLTATSICDKQHTTPF